MGRSGLKLQIESENQFPGPLGLRAQKVQVGVEESKSTIIQEFRLFFDSVWDFLGPGAERARELIFRLYLQLWARRARNTQPIWTIFLSAPKTPPPQKRKSYFYCRLARLKLFERFEHYARCFKDGSEVAWSTMSESVVRRYVEYRHWADAEGGQHLPAMVHLVAGRCLCFGAIYPSSRGNLKGWFPKGWFWRMFPRNENRNEGTFGCSPGTKTGTRARSHVPLERKPERGYIRQNHPFTKPPFYLPVIQHALLCGRFRAVVSSVFFQAVAARMLRGRMLVSDSHGSSLVAVAPQLSGTATSLARKLPVKIVKINSIAILS